MAIRDHFRRAMRLSNSSDGSSQNDAETGTSTPASSNTSESSSSTQKSPSPKLSRTWTWGSSKEKFPGKERKPKTSKSNKSNKTRVVHPSEKPLTAQNLQHQEMLSQFTWTFGASRPEQVLSHDFTDSVNQATADPPYGHVPRIEDRQSEAPNSSIAPKRSASLEHWDEHIPTHTQTTHTKPNTPQPTNQPHYGAIFGPYYTDWFNGSVPGTFDADLLDERKD
ncbi:hypothetical protein G7046_g4382 [Stylonectria norvegica]|nr:hypothetical protein G7046_g4382 [Stylonectria norvegica]